MNWFEAIFRVFHVLAAVCWIGGLYFMIRAVRPVLLQGNNPENNFSVFRVIQRKFVVLAGMMLLTVLVTGMGNVYIVINNFSGATPPMNWMILLTIKLILALILFGIYAVNFFSIRKQSLDSTEKPGFFLPRTALILGLIIIAIGVILHTRLAY